MRALVIAISLVALVGCEESSLGAACSDTAPCTGGLVCAEGRTPGVRVCMRSCDVDADSGVPGRLCNDGTVCIEATLACYPGGRTPIGDPCTDPLECEAGTTCSPDLGICEQVCTPGQTGPGPCDTNEVCLDIGGGICRGGAGADCGDWHTCEASLRCAATDRAGRPVCMATCASRLCERACDADAEGCPPVVCECVESETELHVCYLGGSVGIGGRCSSSLQCAAGGICTDRGICEQACTPGAHHCPENQQCVTTSADRAACIAAGGVCRTP